MCTHRRAAGVRVTPPVIPFLFLIAACQLVLSASRHCEPLGGKLRYTRPKMQRARYAKLPPRSAAFSRTHCERTVVGCRGCAPLLPAVPVCDALASRASRNASGGPDCPPVAAAKESEVAEGSSLRRRALPSRVRRALALPLAWAAFLAPWTGSASSWTSATASREHHFGRAADAGKNSAATAAASRLLCARGQHVRPIRRRRARRLL